jgi:hypothetical protein
VPFTQIGLRETRKADAFSIGPRQALLLGDNGAVIWTVVTGYQCVSTYALSPTMKASQIMESPNNRSFCCMAVPSHAARQRFPTGFGLTWIKVITA